MSRLTALVLVLLAGLLPAPAGARRNRHNDLIRVTSPPVRGTALAHPFVNVIVFFDSRADPQTFRARLGRTDVTSRFVGIAGADGTPGKQAAIEPSLLRVGRAVNHLRLEVRGLPIPTKRGRAKRLRDIDRVRFRAVPAPDQPPVAQLSGPDIVFPGIPVQFSARGSADPDLDLLTFHWDFGDGTTSDDRNPTRVFADTAADLTVRLTVSDGQQAVSSEKTLFACPALDAGRTPGTLKIEASGPLEFGSVAPGTSATRTLTVRNVSTDPTSQLKGRLEVGLALPPPAADSSGFTVAPAAVDLGAGETSSVTVTFAPTTAGHQAAHLVLVACATNRPAAHLWAHGFGGSGAGPVFAAEPLFFADLSGATFAILADGTRVAADNTLHSCQNANGTGTSDLCATNADCVTPGETCALTSVCVGGDRPGQVCNTPADCPGGFCRSTSLGSDPVDMCGDGTGGLYLMTDIGTFTDPNLNASTDLSTSVVQLEFDPQTGARTAADILARTTDETQVIACDGVAPEAGGLVYVPEFFNVDFPATPCSRDSREALTAFSKSTGPPVVIVADIAAAAGYGECDDFDPTSDLEVARDGSAIFASLPLTGLSRIRPTPLPISPDIIDYFQVHPDGSIVYVTTSDSVSTGSLNIYKISPDQALAGAQRLAELTPCVVQVPNNCVQPSGSTFVPCPADPNDPVNRGETLLGLSSFAVGRAAPGSSDGVLLVSFVTRGGFADLGSNLLVRGTVAVALPAQSNTNACTVLGLVSLEFLDPMTF
ncbi:MAG: PKD domain-containing protein [Deltaproteobacteria bacterium]|nr:MAG: PKD domain-containing protein [Deltaproteobacteria bacterium]